MKSEGIDEFKSDIELTQLDAIKERMVVNYVGIGKRIRKWNPHDYILPQFSRYDALRKHALCAIKRGETPKSKNLVHKLLDSMAEAGELTRYQYKKGRMIMFYMDRSTCDRLAARAEQELRESGLEYDE